MSTNDFDPHKTNYVKPAIKTLANTPYAYIARHLIQDAIEMQDFDFIPAETIINRLELAQRCILQASENHPNKWEAYIAAGLNNRSDLENLKIQQIVRITNTELDKIAQSYNILSSTSDTTNIIQIRSTKKHKINNTSQLQNPEYIKIRNALTKYKISLASNNFFELLNYDRHEFYNLIRTHYLNHIEQSLDTEHSNSTTIKNIKLALNIAHHDPKCAVALDKRLGLTFGELQVSLYNMVDYNIYIALRKHIETPSESTMHTLANLEEELQDLNIDYQQNIGRKYGEACANDYKEATRASQTIQCNEYMNLFFNNATDMSCIERSKILLKAEECAKKAGLTIYDRAALAQTSTESYLTLRERAFEITAHRILSHTNAATIQSGRVDIDMLNNFFLIPDMVQAIGHHKDMNEGYQIIAGMDKTDFEKKLYRCCQPYNAINPAIEFGKLPPETQLFINRKSNTFDNQ